MGTKCVHIWPSSPLDIPNDSPDLTFLLSYSKYPIRKQFLRSESFHRRHYIWLHRRRHRVSLLQLSIFRSDSREIYFSTDDRTVIVRLYWYITRARHNSLWFYIILFQNISKQASLKRILAKYREKWMQTTEQPRTAILIKLLNKALRKFPFPGIGYVTCRVTKVQCTEGGPSLFSTIGSPRLWSCSTWLIGRGGGVYKWNLYQFSTIRNHVSPRGSSRHILQVPTVRSSEHISQFLVPIQTSSKSYVRTGNNSRLRENCGHFTVGHQNRPPPKPAVRRKNERLELECIKSSLDRGEKTLRELVDACS